MRLTHQTRLLTAGATSSLLCVVAGIVAFTGEPALKIASGLVVASLVVSLVGYAYADNRRLGWGMFVLIAATLPLFGALYGIGDVMMRHLGAGVAGGALIVLGVATAAGTVALLRSGHRLGGEAQDSRGYAGPSSQ